MQTLVFLILFPLLAAVAMLAVKAQKARRILTRISAAIISAASIFLAWQFFGSTQEMFQINPGILTYVFLAAEVLICGVIVFMSIRHKKILPIILSVAQTGLMVYYELFMSHGSHSSAYLFVDKLSVILALIIGVIGSLICIFAVSYMEDFHHHHREVKDKTNRFMALLFIVISAMFGIIFSNNLVWLAVFWEITSLCSFLLIQYTGTREAIKNGFTAINLNLVGGAGLCVSVVLLGVFYNIHEIGEVLNFSMFDDPLFGIVLLGFALAGVSKAAQIPFSKWLLGAMVAPTPTSALLHSSTMVKAGVYLLLRLSPALCGNSIISMTVIFIGGITFLVASILAIPQTDAKRTLAYSTIANLGLIVTCSGVGGYEAMWAGILLLIFHAISKSLLFLCVGTIEHQLGSRDIEDMHGLIVKLPALAFFMIVGIAGMFLAPFGMLISKWATLKALVDSHNILFVLILALGSAATLFYWTKWLGNVVVVLPKSEKIPYRMNIDVRITFYIEAALTTLLCALFPVVSKYMISPFLTDVYHFPDMAVVTGGNQAIITIMLIMIVLLPALLRVVTSRDDRITSAYMGGVNAGDGRHFIDAHGNRKRLYLSNWYMQDLIPEKKILFCASIALILALALCAVFLLGGVL